MGAVNENDNKSGDDNGNGSGQPEGVEAELQASEDLVEVFAADNDITVAVAIAEVLRPEGIDAFAHDRRSHALPAPDSEMGMVGIAVPKSQAAQARALLQEALRDGALLDGRLATERAEV